MNAEAVARIKCCLSETQFRRLWLFRVEGLTVREIAKQEHISFQCVHKSVCAAEKKITVSRRKGAPSGLATTKSLS